MTPQVAWAKALGIETSKKKDTWRANIVVQTGDEIPPGVCSSATDTRFELWVWLAVPKSVRWLSRTPPDFKMCREIRMERRVL